MVRLDREDRVAGGDQLGPPLGRQQELSLRIESIVRAWLDREERVERGDRFLPPIQLREGVGFRIQRARVARIERHDLRRLLKDVVPAGERPERLEPADMGREGFRREGNGAIVRGNGIDVPADLVQEPRAALPGNRIAVPLPQGFVVRTQRLFVLVRRREDVPPKPPGVRVVGVNLDHAVETAQRPLRFARGEVRRRLAFERLLQFGVDPKRAVERGLGFLQFVPPPMRIAFPHPEGGVLRDECEDPGVPVDIVRVEVHGLHVRADRLGRLFERGVGVAFPLPQDLRLRLDAQACVVVGERVRGLPLSDEDVSLQAQAVRISAVGRQGPRRSGLRRFEAADAQESGSDVRERIGEVPGSRRRFNGFEESERLEERASRPCGSVGVEGRESRARESVRLVEDATFPIEKALEEGHPCHPIPRDPVQRTVSDKRPTCGRDDL